ncbi:MAG: hypothetical protein ACI8PZ_002258 [Myxococcota bacterium]|jgi:hypothetical protein
MAALHTLMWLGAVALAQSGPPDRRIPPSVLSEVALLENRFELALAQDCASERCYPKGCVYVDHTVADRAPAVSMPGLGFDPAPQPEQSQAHLTRARCAFAHEADIEGEDVAALGRRLGIKLSSGWVAVSVSHQPLSTIPAYLREAPAPEVDTDPPEAAPEPPPPPPRSETRELWEALLPHLWWMIGLGLLTVAGTVLIWAFRRVGQPSVEDQLLLAELEGGAGEPEPPADAEDADGAFVAAQHAAWSERLAAMDPTAPDLEVQALVRELLRAGELPLLAKAMLRFPDTLPKAFPAGGDVASEKLALAEYLKSADLDELPDDAAFFRALNRHALAASVASQADAQIVRSLREDFGAAGLAELVEQLPPRPAALVYALAPAGTRFEMLRLVGPGRLAQLAEMLLRSDRMDPDETANLFALLTTLRAGGAPPEWTLPEGVTDRGPTFDAVGPLSVLLEGVPGPARAALFRDALDRSHGSLPDWTRGILSSDFLFALPTEAWADLALQVDVAALAAWLSLVEANSRTRLVTGLPGSVQSAVRASSVFRSRTEQLALAERGRAALAAGFHAQLARAGIRFEDVLGQTEAAG